MENLIKVSGNVASYIDYMKSNFYSLIGALNVVDGNSEEEKKFISNYLKDSDNQEKFVKAWLYGYKIREKFYMVKIKHFREADAYLNYEEEDNVFFFSGRDYVKGYKTKFTKNFLIDNNLYWMIDSEGVEIIEVEND